MSDVELVGIEVDCGDANYALHMLKRANRKMKLIIEELTTHQKSPLDPARHAKLKQDYANEIEFIKKVWQSSHETL